MEARSPAKEGFVIHPATRMGHVHLTVADLDRQISFYQKVLGLSVQRREGSVAAMGAGNEDLLRLTERRGARRLRGTTGLYHFAVLLPNLREFARVLARLIELRYANAPTDHVMTEATYLSDPEGNGIEMYVDTPERGSWTVVNGEFMARDAKGIRRSGRDPLDVEEVLGALAPGDRLDAPLPEETRIGHVHLHVADVTEATDFYRNILGFEAQILSPTMGFVSAGGYHHHIGFNTWPGEGAPPPTPDALGLRYFTIVLPNRRERDRVAERVRAANLPVDETPDGFFVSDPSQNSIMLTAAA